jgi:hypothetical protein
MKELPAAELGPTVDFCKKSIVLTAPDGESV